MSKYITVTGYVLLVIGLLSITPIFDLLPVDMWAKLINIFTGEETIYFKVVPSNHGYTINFLVIALGLALVVASKYIFPNKLKGKSNKNE